MDKMTNKETFIRGGRLRKTSKGLVSFAPFLAGASTLALGALLATASPVEAGNCGAFDGDTTAGWVSTCTGGVNAGGDITATVEPTAQQTGSVTVGDGDSFVHEVASGEGIRINTLNTNALLTVDLDGNITAAAAAEANGFATEGVLDIRHNSTSAGVEVTTDGTITSSGGRGIWVTFLLGDSSVTANGAITVEDEGITFGKSSIGAMNVTTGADGDITSRSEEGIVITSAQQGASGAVTLDIGGDITSAKGGIYFVQQSGSNGIGDAISITTRENSVIAAIGNGMVSSIDKNAKQDSRGGGTTGHAINIGRTHMNSTDVTVVVNGDLGMDTDAGRLYYHGINLRHQGTGNVNVTINGDVFGGYNTRATNISSLGESGTMTLTLNGNVNTLDGRAVRGFGGSHGGRGLLDITIGSGATVTGFGNVLGSGSDGGTHITIDGTVNIMGTEPAVYSRPDSNNVETEIDINNTVSGSIGVTMNNVGSATMNLDISSTVTGTGGTAVFLRNGSGSRGRGTGGHVVTLEQGGALSGGIRSDNTGSTGVNSAVQLDINGMITVTSGDAIELGGTSAHTITLREQASVMGTIDVSAAAGGTTIDISGAVNPTSGNAIEFGGAGSHTVILRDGANIAGRIAKADGATGSVEFRIEGDITGNPIKLTNGDTDANKNTFNNFGASDSIVIADGARFELGMGTAFNSTPVNLFGRLVFSGVSDDTQANLANFRGMGGEIEMDLDFKRGDRERTIPRFALNNLNNSGMRVPVNIRAVDGLPRFSENEEGEIVIGDGTLDTDGDGAITIGNIIDTFSLGTLGKDHFVAGEWLDNGVDDGDWELRLVCTGCDDPLVKSQWNVVAVPGQQNRPGTGGGPGGPAVLAGPATLFDTLPMVLAHLGQPESLHRRTQNRSFQQGTGVWGRTQTGSVSIETTAAPFEVDAHNIAFGVHAPVFSRGVSESVTLNANVALQTSEIEALVADGKQDIQTNAVIGGVGATWKRGGLYADGQFQYARFDNDLDTADDTRLASPTADSFTAGVEVGYVFDGGDVNLGEWLGGGVLGNVFLTPSAQVSWSQVGFSDFVSTDGKAVSLDDGTVINGRVGAVFETNWENVVFYEAFAPAVVRLQGSADVIFPLDGEVVTLVDGAKQSSEREDPVLDLGVGVSYTWEKANHAYTLSTDVSSLQGSEVDGYEANVGFKYQF